MAHLQDLLASKIIPIRSNIHKCKDTGTLRTLSDGVRYTYENDKAQFEYKSGTSNLWDSVNSIVKDTILDSKIDISVGGIMNAPSANTRFEIELVVPAPTEIPIIKRTIEISRNGVNISHDISFLIYNTSESFQYGYKIFMTPIGGNIDISQVHILVRV